MPAKRTIPIGTRFGRLTVLGASPPDRAGNHAWGCRCDCGRIVVVLGYNLQSGHSSSCGCLSVELVRRRATTHGMSHRAPEYGVWRGMRTRCLNPNRRDYPKYGGRGITICKEWDDFAVFYRDMGPRPSSSHSLDRIDNDGPYAPWNCRWASRSQQNRNRRVVRLLTWRGQTRSVIEWAERTGLMSSTITRRLALGWPLERVLTAPVDTRKRHHQDALNR